MFANQTRKSHKPFYYICYSIDILIRHYRNKSSFRFSNHIQKILEIRKLGSSVLIVEDMANYIMQIFRAYAMVVFSWGFNAPTATANGLRFKVQGFKFKGTVEVEYNEGADLFEVKLIKNGKVVETVEDVYLDSLVDVIDYRVEKVDNYKERIETEYSL